MIDLSPTQVSIKGSIATNVNTGDVARQLTDQLLLIGHGDLTVNGQISLNDPHRITGVEHAMKLLGGDASSPLLKAFFEAYHAGARDIILCAAAPMSEWEPVGERTAGFYTTYFNRLDTTYSTLEEYDYPDLVVPIEAVFHDYTLSTPDFLSQLGSFLDGHVTRGKVMIGVLGVRGTGPLTVLSEDSRLSTVGDKGKFVGIVTGEGIFDFLELTVAHTAPLAAAFAGTLTTLPLNLAIAGRVLPSVGSLTTTDPSDAEINEAALAKLIPARTTVRGRRGLTHQVTVATDNTVAPTGSDFQHMATLRMVQQVADQIHGRCSGFLGEGRDIAELEQEVLLTLESLKNENAYREATAQVYEKEPGSIIINLIIKPWFELRLIRFTITVGDNL